MIKSDEINELAKALVKANSKVSNPKKNATNPHFKNEYATLDSVIEAYKSAYLENGISVLENPVTNEGKIGVSITLLHESGQYITHDPFMLPPGRDNAQGYGSSITYARRYALSAVMNIAADDDDDGNGANPDKEPPKGSLSDAQVNRLFAIGKSAGVSAADIKKVLMASYNKTEVKQLTKKEYDEVCNRLENKKGA